MAASSRYRARHCRPFSASPVTMAMPSLELKVPPPLVMLGVALFMWLGSVPVPGLAWPMPARTLCAVVLAALGASIAVAGVVSFVRAHTTVNPLKPGSASSLVVTGVYRFTRNPMYLGDLVILIGWAVFLSNALSFLLVPAFVLYINRFQIGPEEKALSGLFGAEYAAYRSKVHRWL